MCDHGAVNERGNPRLRWADRSLGVPILALLRAVRRGRTQPLGIRRIGLLKMSAIGDTVLLSAIVADLAATFPGAEIVLFTGADNAGVAALIDGPSETVVLSPSRPLHSVKELRRRHLDVLFDFGPWTRLEAIYSALSGSSFTLGFCTADQARHACQDASVAHSGDIHELDNYRRLVALLGVATSTDPSLRPPGVLDPAHRPPAPYAVVHPWPSGYRSELKEWPEARWVELSARLSAAGLGLAITGGKDDVANSRKLEDRLTTAGIAVVNTAGRLSLGEVLDLAAGSACVISVNTGIMHLAAASGAATVGLNGPTSAVRWGPVGAHAVSVNSSLEGCGYLNLGSEYQGRRQDCMEGVSVDAVAEAAFGAIRRAQLTEVGSRRVR